MFGKDPHQQAHTGQEYPDYDVGNQRIEEGIELFSQNLNHNANKMQVLSGI
jgi:hypothetical protein